MFVGLGKDTYGTNFAKKGSMKSLPRFVVGWMIQQRSVKEVIKHNGKGYHQGNTQFPSGVANLLTGFKITKKSISPRSVANLEQQRDKEHNSFP